MSVYMSVSRYLASASAILYENIGIWGYNTRVSRSPVKTRPSFDTCWSQLFYSQLMALIVLRTHLLSLFLERIWEIFQRPFRY
jgi:hypothetical protein